VKNPSEGSEPSEGC